MNKGYANCGASVKPNGKSKMSKGGYLTKKKKPGYSKGGMAQKDELRPPKGGVSGNMGLKNR